MKKIICLATIGLFVCVGMASATDLTLSINRTDCRLTWPMMVQFEVKGLLSDVDNMGLGAFGFDLSATKDGGDFDLTTGITSVEGGPAVEAFSLRGLTNPEGFGGTAMADGRLAQIGGGQNTIDNPGGNPPYPYGDVDFNIGHAEVVLALVEVNLAEEGVYVFAVNAGFANVMDPDQVEAPYMVTMVVNVSEDALTVQPMLCPWDLTGDTVVNPLDGNRVKDNYGCAVNTGDCECDKCDFTGDSIVNPLDLNRVKDHYGPCPE